MLGPGKAGGPLVALQRDRPPGLGVSQPRSLASALCGTGGRGDTPPPRRGPGWALGLLGWISSRKAHPTDCWQGLPLLRAASEPCRRPGQAAVLCNTRGPPSPPDLSLWGSGYAAPLATSRHCFGFWGGSSWSGTWVWPGGCPQPSHGLCPPGPPQLFAPPEPWRVRKTQPRTVCFLGASLSPSLMPLQLPFWGYRRVTPCNQRKPRADDGREASWRRRQAWRDGAHPGPVWSPHSAQQQACVRATLDGSERLQTRRGALCEPEGLEVIHGGAGAAEWVRAVSVAGQWSPPASAWCWPWDFLIWGTQEGWEAAAGSAL